MFLAFCFLPVHVGSELRKMGSVDDNDPVAMRASMSQVDTSGPEASVPRPLIACIGTLKLNKSVPRHFVTCSVNRYELIDMVLAHLSLTVDLFVLFVLPVVSSFQDNFMHQQNGKFS
jgi:hypothetical protein